MTAATADRCACRRESIVCSKEPVSPTLAVEKSYYVALCSYCNIDLKCKSAYEASIKITPPPPPTPTPPALAPETTREKLLVAIIEAWKRQATLQLPALLYQYRPGYSRFRDMTDEHLLSAITDEPIPLTSRPIKRDPGSQHDNWMRVSEEAHIQFTRTGKVMLAWGDDWNHDDYLIDLTAKLAEQGLYITTTPSEKPPIP